VNESSSPRSSDVIGRDVRHEMSWTLCPLTMFPPNWLMHVQRTVRCHVSISHLTYRSTNLSISPAWADSPIASADEKLINYITFDQQLTTDGPIRIGMFIICTTLLCKMRWQFWRLHCRNSTRLKVLAV